MKRPAMPRDLPPEAKAEWGRVVHILEEMGALHTADRALLVRYCRGWDEWCSLDADLARTGRVIKGRDGNVVRNPLWLMRQQSGQALNELSSALGISPSARLRSGIKHQRPDEGESAGDITAPTAIDDYRARLGAQ